MTTKRTCPEILNALLGALVIEDCDECFVPGRRYAMPFSDETSALIEEARAAVVAAHRAPDLLAALRECITEPGAHAERTHALALRRLRAISILASAAISAVTGEGRVEG